MKYWTPVSTGETTFYETIKIDKAIKSRLFSTLSFLQNQKPCYFNLFWTPSGAYPGETRGRSDDFGNFYETIIAFCFLARWICFA